MRFTSVALALAVSLPALASAQGTAKPVPPGMKASYVAMQTNVARITEVAEKDRWQSNVTMWGVRLGHMGKLTPGEVSKVEMALVPMIDNVSRITDPAEKERWQANVDLWQAMENAGDKVSVADRQKMKQRLATMIANVAKIKEAGEKGRWVANRDLWQTMLAQL